MGNFYGCFFIYAFPSKLMDQRCQLTSTIPGSRVRNCHGPMLASVSIQRKIGDVEYYVVAKRIYGKWKELARFLPPRNVFTEGELTILQSDNKDNLEETIVRMLSTWKEKHPDLATVGHLAKTLLSLERADITIQLHP
ncbi:uncharacterized protein LOC111627834 isoform X2 [Centruroides sculpturatus]|uniref:uncharacterized protein LOC111627834 isoform X2 n=1 Tax=Centruroides sculpturatus TaxID=218467 RepID=UPI000C6E994A|nr:uncharacterized protein LOC111627834 isoform X2 [Centruroides sculpturatus]XP_023227258.1 uncharacterized protein LOC111627834 isoform X2 [Centruroides sculpturatus]